MKILVTGASGFIGGRFARFALEQGMSVRINGRRAEGVEHLVRRGAEFVQGDLTDPQLVRALCDDVDAVVHSAGVAVRGTAEEVSREEFRRVLELNVVAVADLTRLLLPALRAARGQVVVMNSGSGFVSGAANGIYAASKFAVRAWADALRDEERGVVRVSSIHPGRVDTDMQVELQAAEGRAYDTSKLLTAVSVARAVVFALKADADACVESLVVRPAARWE